MIYLFLFIVLYTPHIFSADGACPTPKRQRKDDLVLATIQSAEEALDYLDGNFFDEDGNPKHEKYKNNKEIVVALLQDIDNIWFNPESTHAIEAAYTQRDGNDIEMVRQINCWEQHRANLDKVS